MSDIGESNMTLAVAKNKIEEVRGTCIELKKTESLTMAQADDLAGEGSFVFFLFFSFGWEPLLYFIPLFPPITVGPILRDMWCGELPGDRDLESLVEGLFAELSSGLSYPEALRSLFERLTHIHNGLQALKTKGTYNSLEVSRFQDQLNEIDSNRVRGEFVDEKGNTAPGQAVLSAIMNKSYQEAHKLLFTLSETSSLSHNNEAKQTLFLFLFLLFSSFFFFSFFFFPLSFFVSQSSL